MHACMLLLAFTVGSWQIAYASKATAPKKPATQTKSSSHKKVIMRQHRTQIKPVVPQKQIVPESKTFADYYLEQDKAHQEHIALFMKQLNAEMVDNKDLADKYDALVKKLADAQSFLAPKRAQAIATWRRLCPLITADVLKATPLVTQESFLLSDEDIRQRIVRRSKYASLRQDSSAELTSTPPADDIEKQIADAIAERDQTRTELQAKMGAFSPEVIQTAKDLGALFDRSQSIGNDKIGQMMMDLLRAPFSLRDNMSLWLSRALKNVQTDDDVSFVPLLLFSNDNEIKKSIGLESAAQDDAYAAKNIQRLCGLVESFIAKWYPQSVVELF